MNQQRVRDKGIRVLVEELNGSLLVAALNGGRIDNLEVDSVAQEVRWGSVYWGRVSRIDKTMDAAFVELDTDNIGLLNAADIFIKKDDGTVMKGGEYGIGKLVKNGDFILVQAKDDYLIPTDPDAPLPEERKYPRLSMNISLPGRYLVCTPTETQNQVSHRIRDKAMRKQLLEMLETLTDCEGVILRAAAANTQTDILMREHQILRRMWDHITQYAEGNEPQLIMLGPDAIQRSLSDLAHKTIDRVEVGTDEYYEDIVDWCELFAPDLMTKITVSDIEADDNLALFTHYDLQQQIEALLRPYTLLQGGGSIIIEETAAATLIDVNRGNSKSSALSLNMDAAAEIARQIRLRNLGGILIVDFLRLKTAGDKKAFEQTLDRLVQSDPCTVQVHGFTRLGLMEMTRKRRTLPLMLKLQHVIDA